MSQYLAKNWIEKEDASLSEAGFELLEGNLWTKEGVVYGRRAALQEALHVWGKNGSKNGSIKRKVL